MAHIPLPEGLPGILGLLAARPDTGRPLTDLAQTLLRGPSTLTPGERETIAAHVSKGNECRFCEGSHAAAADALGADDSPKLDALLAIAGKVRLGGRHVTAADIEAARERGATDAELHDTVLIAAAFCMYNRYVDGLATWAPEDPAAYVPMGRRLAERGYEPIPPAPPPSRTTRPTGS